MALLQFGNYHLFILHFTFTFAHLSTYVRPVWLQIYRSLHYPCFRTLPLLTWLSLDGHSSFGKFLNLTRSYTESLSHNSSSQQALHAPAVALFQCSWIPMRNLNLRSYLTSMHNSEPGVTDIVPVYTHVCSPEGLFPGIGQARTETNLLFNYRHICGIYSSHINTCTCEVESIRCRLSHVFWII